MLIVMIKKYDNYQTALQIVQILLQRIKNAYFSEYTLDCLVVSRRLRM